MDARLLEMFRRSKLFPTERRHLPDNYHRDTAQHAVAFLNCFCRRDIIIRQASVRQAKFVPSALSRPRSFLPTARILAFVFFSSRKRRFPRRCSAQAGVENLYGSSWPFRENAVAGIQ
jgi:hypothetical protein